MSFRFVKLFEDFDSGKFSIEDIDSARKMNKGIFTSIVKNFPEHKKDEPLKIIDIDDQSGEISVSIDNNIFYVDLKNVEKIES
jgi:hypothetical protein